MEKLSELIASAQKNIDVEVENIGSRELAAAFERAVQRKVKVRVLIPQCGFSEDPGMNYPHLRLLSEMGVQTRVLPSDKTPLLPHLHAKLMQVDRKVTYLGSINFSYNSTMKARELGVILSNPRENQQLQSEFEKDWARGIDSDGLYEAGTCPERKPKWVEAVGF